MPPAVPINHYVESKQAYMAYKLRLNITAEVYWLKIYF